MSARRSTEFSNREISWLEFNTRVLEEAEDPGNPLLERLRFFCIFHSNLDEFFMVRVASLLNKARERDHRRDAAGLTPSQQLAEIFSRVKSLLGRSDRLYYTDLLPALALESIRVLEGDEISQAHDAHLDQYFDREIYPVLTPVAVEEGKEFPRLAGLALNLAVALSSDNEPDGESRLAIVQVPGKLPGLIRLPGSEGLEFCWLSDVIRERLQTLFRGYRIEEVAAFRLTRDSELELDDEGYLDYMSALEFQLKRRRKASTVRLECREGMSAAMRERLRQRLKVSESLIQESRSPLDPRPLLSLADLTGCSHLRYPSQPPLLHPVFEQHSSIFDIVREGDILLHHPYDSFAPVVGLIERAAEDPDVLAIKQTLYRTSGPASPIVRALMRAAEAGKQVTVLVELMARFDEERNISWARNLEEAGAHVIFGLVGLKVHAKIALVVRREAEGIRRYVHLGTGNYNERTARVYTDAGLLTAAEDFGLDASGFFNTITGYSEPPMFSRLVMAPSGMRQMILEQIRREIDRMQSGQSAGIAAKMNSLVDPEIISELYRASRAGVPVRLNVRGICCLQPGIPGLSENITVISIVDRYLEHSRVFHFRNGGEEEVFLSSADWMPRNLDRRVELMFPIVQPHCRDRIIGDLEAQFGDSRKARILKPDGTYDRVTARGAGGKRVQDLLYRRLSEEYSGLRRGTPVRFIPLESKD